MIYDLLILKKKFRKYYNHFGKRYLVERGIGENFEDNPPKIIVSI